MLDSTLVEAELTPAMSAAEQRLLRHAAAGASAAVEFGCGGSTLLLLEAVSGPLISVETDPDWLARLRETPSCAAAGEAGRWVGLHADLGPVGNWGWPNDRTRFADGPRYWNAPWHLCPEPNFVLVDGRFRVAAALAALRRMAPGGIVAVHDFWPRTNYHALLQIAELVGTAASLVLLARRPDQELPGPGDFATDPR